MNLCFSSNNYLKSNQIENSSPKEKYEDVLQKEKILKKDTQRIDREKISDNDGNQTKKETKSNQITIKKDKKSLILFFLVSLLVIAIILIIIFTWRFLHIKRRKRS